MEYIKVSKTARIATHGNPKAKRLWVVLHGYGQLVPFFIRHFQGLHPEENFVIAPEGLHRFYLNGTSGRVGASWMTKEEREQDIKDYIAYLDQLMYQYKGNYDQYVLLGFSQGVATSSRWMNLGSNKFDVLINWAGVFPPDLKDNQLEPMKHSRNFYVYGTEDPYFSEDQLKSMRSRYEHANLDLDVLTFNGKHELNKEVLTQIENNIRR